MGLKGQTKRDERSQFSQFLQIFTDFCIFSLSWELQHCGSADFRRKPQETGLFKAQLGEAFLEMLIFLHFFHLFSAKPALKAPTPALKMQTRHLKKKKKIKKMKTGACAPKPALNRGSR